jgi:hypothetical protein
MPTGRQDREFIQMMEIEDLIEVKTTIKNSALEYAIDWISKNIDPEDVFSETQLEKWAEANGYVKATDNE